LIYTRGDARFDTVSLGVAVGEAPVSAEGGIPPVPSAGITAVQAVVTRKCNLECSYCNVRLSGDKSSTMDADTVKKVIGSAALAPPGRLFMVTGGEPLMVPHITMKLLESVAPPVVLFTNATLLNEETAQRIGELGVSPVVSMDGMDKAHDPSRCRTWHMVARGLDILRNAGVAYGISTVVNAGNYRSIGEEMEAMYDRFHPTGMGFNIIHWTGTGFHPLRPEEYADAMEQVFLKAVDRGIFVDQVARRIGPVIFGKYRHRDCSAMGGKIVFHPDGSVSNCISARNMNDWSCMIPARMAFCEGCPAAGICGGGCAWDAVHLGKGGPDPRHCAWVTRILDLFLDLVAADFPRGQVTTGMLKERYMPLVSRGASPLGGSIGHGS
jgi:uncharacterized protein